MAEFNPAKFVREVRQETARVTWPSRKETLISAGMVFVLTLIMAVFFLLVDNIVRWGVETILGFGQ